MYKYCQLQKFLRILSSLQKRLFEIFRTHVENVRNRNFRKTSIKFETFLADIAFKIFGVEICTFKQWSCDVSERCCIVITADFYDDWSYKRILYSFQ